MAALSPVPPTGVAASLGTTTPDRLDSLVEPLDAAEEGISHASHQLRALAALSGSLTDPLTPEEAAEIVERHALAALGATSAVIVTLGTFPPNEPRAVRTSLATLAVPSLEDASLE